jgi:hypothetical protein
VLISAFSFGTPKKAVTKAVKESELFVSPQLLSEYREVPLELAARNKINPEQF